MSIHPAAAAGRPIVETAVLLVCILAPASLAGQQPAGVTPSGPMIQSEGRSIQVDNPTFKAPTGHVFKAVWVIDRGDTAGVNQQLMTIARYLNVHARHGVPRDRLHAAAVVHGSGWIAILNDSAYGARYGGTANPSNRMVQELLANGVQLVLCGQTAGIRGVQREELLAGIQLAISAMTALNVFQAQGYQLNPW